MASAAVVFELAAIGEPRELSRNLFALVAGRIDLEGKAAFDQAHDLAFDAADVVEIGDDPFSDGDRHGRADRRAASRDINELAGVLFLALPHEAPDQRDSDPLMA